MKLSTIKNIIFFILIVLAIFGHVYAISLEPYDELWNFQNVFKLHSGYSMYSDANIIITPIFYLLGLSFFKFFGASIISFRYFNICITLLFFILLYLIFKNLKASKHINILFLTLVLAQIFSVVNGGANYNMLANAFVLLGILSYIKLSEKKYHHFLQGFIIFLIFFTKQNIGIFYACSILVFDFIYRKNLLSFFINQLKKGVTFLTPLLIAFIIFFKNNILFDFFNYTFGGILDFGNSNTTFDASLNIVVIMAIILFLYLFIIFSKKTFSKDIITDERRKNLHLIGIVTIGISFSIFPIANTAHFLYVFPFYAIILFYFLDFALLEEILDSKKNIKLTYILSILILFFLVIKLFYSYIVETETHVMVSDKNNPFYQTRLSYSNFEKMDVMADYIKTKSENQEKVIIIAFDSALAMVPLNQNNQAFDLVFNGNLGYNGETYLIDKIKNSTNTEFLIHTNEDDCHWQEAQNIRTFIVENLEKTGEILNYSIYKLP